MLTNIAKLMQVNLTKGMENAQKYNVQINKSENFDITKALVLLFINNNNCITVRR